MRSASERVSRPRTKHQTALNPKWLVWPVLVLATLAIFFGARELLGLLVPSSSSSITSGRDFFVPGIFFTLGLLSWAVAIAAHPSARPIRAFRVVSWIASLAGGALLLFIGADFSSALAEAGLLALLDFIVVWALLLALWCIVRGALNLRGRRSA